MSGMNPFIETITGRDPALRDRSFRSLCAGLSPEALLAACDEFRRGEPVPAQCNAMCFAPCVGEDGDTGVRLRADPENAEAWDELGGEVIGALATKLRACEVNRKACDQCLQRLEKRKVIVL